MNKRAIISLLLTAAVFLTSGCTGVTVTDSSSSRASFVCNLKWNEAEDPARPDSLILALARTVYSIHDTTVLKPTRTDTVHVFNGRWFATVYGTSGENSYIWENQHAFVTAPGQVALMDISCSLPEEAAPEDDSFLKGLYPMNHLDYRAVVHAAPLWQATREKELTHGNLESIEFPMVNLVQEITVRLKVVPDIPGASVRRVAASLMGVPLQVRAIDGTVSPEATGRAVKELTPESDGSSFYRGTFRTLGLFPPISKEDKYGSGVIEIAMLLEKDAESFTKSTRVNIWKAISNAKLLVPAQDEGRYRIGTNAATLDLTTLFTIHVDNRQETDAEAVVEWLEDGNTVPVLPEDPEA